MSLLVRSRRVRELSKVISSGRLRILLSLSSSTEMAVREDNCSGSNCSIWLFPKYKSCTQTNRNRWWTLCPHCPKHLGIFVKTKVALTQPNRNMHRNRHVFTHMPVSPSACGWKWCVRHACSCMYIGTLPTSWCMNHMNHCLCTQ